MIPKVIHYCWFGRNPKPKLFFKCLKSWKKYCPDFEIREWNEGNYDLISAPIYVKQAYEAKKWAFVTDYVRLKVVYENGGVYLDTDVELLRSLDELLKHDAYFGMEKPGIIATGLGFGAKKENSYVKAMLDDYVNLPFIEPETGAYDLLPCPQRNTKALMKLLPSGLDFSSTVKYKNIVILSSDYLNPLDYFSTEPVITQNTYSIHHYAASWEGKEFLRKKRFLMGQTLKQRLCRFFLRVIKFILGNKFYNRLKGQ